jgi:hypothetical protein
MQRLTRRIPGGIWTVIVAPVLSAAAVAVAVNWLNGPTVTIESATRRGDAELRAYLTQQGEALKPRWRGIRACEGVVYEVRVKTSGLSDVMHRSSRGRSSTTPTTRSRGARTARSPIFDSSSGRAAARPAASGSRTPTLMPAGACTSRSRRATRAAKQ